MDLNRELDQEISANYQIEQELEEALNPRSKTSLRMHYEAQVAVIQRQLGSLEDVRLKLGLSQRKMAQLLLVDPSSWTRWNRPSDEAPPHIWRALQWYMTLQDKIPGLSHQYFLGADPKIFHEKALRELEGEKLEREREMRKLFLQVKHLGEEKDLLSAHFESLKKDLKFHKNVSILSLLLFLIFSTFVGVYFWNNL